MAFWRRYTTLQLLSNEVEAFVAIDCTQKMILKRVVFDARIIKQRFRTALLIHHVESLKSGADEALMRDLLA